MKQFRHSWALAALLLGTTQLQAEVPLKVVRGARDTVFTQKHYIVGLTEAGCTAKVNGEEAKVYKTGAFAAQVMLKEGANQVEVSVAKGTETNTQTLNIFYTSTRPEKKFTLKEAQQELEKTTFKPCNLFAISKPGAYLQYGDGSDRLGGSKMNYVDEGIVFKVVGEIGRLYKVQLAENRWAYIPKNALEVTDKETKCINTGSWSVTNTGKTDRVSISLTERLPYYTWTQLDPTTICVELYGAMNNSNWISQKRGLKMIEYVDFRQLEGDVLQVIIKLQKQHAWGYSVSYQGTNLVIEVKHTPALTLKGMVIGLDAGHGGPYDGAVGNSGLKEKDVNLSLVKEFQALLEAKGATVVLSREGDYNVDMVDRKAIFKEKNIDLMVSIHNNSGGSPLNFMGTSTYYKQIVNRDLAETMLNRLLELGLKDFGLVGNFNFTMNAPTEYPNVLLEVLFMSSLPEEEMLADEAFRKKVAKQALLGLEDYLKKVKAAERK
ncbi:MAG: N-acetylmuramoyl-L-alanine amidase [Bacteroides sp.]|nr:N-acetylmuramoyl-L-alanine amidase [Bacteroides sp.]